MCKGELTREIAKHDAIDAMLICVFKTVEPLLSFALHCNPEAKKLEVRMEPRKVGIPLSATLDCAARATHDDVCAADLRRSP